jgi:predicted LppA-like lipoprotein
MIRLVVGVLGVLMVCVSVFGCGAGDPGAHRNPGPQRTADLENGLRSKPSFEAARAEYAAVMNQMAAEIAVLVPGMKWSVDENSWGPCGGDYTWTRAVRVFYRIVFDRVVPDDVWPRAVQVVKDGTRRFGATNVSVFVDQPGNKDMGISGSGAQFHFGTAVNTVFSATSDCRMRASDSAPI